MPKPRILFVEDEDYIARVIKSSLEDAGYEVFRANSLVQGRVEAATRSPELLILDLGLPDGDGTDLIRTLRSYSSVPIIILSARSGDDAKVEALDLGADDYISKPFSMMELLARVRAHLRRAAGDGCRNAVFTFGDVTVDQARGVVLKGKDEVHLTKLEFRLLCVLIAGRGRVLTHRQLLADVVGKLLFKLLFARVLNDAEQNRFNFVALQRFSIPLRRISIASRAPPGGKSCTAKIA